MKSIILNIAFILLVESAYAASFTIGRTILKIPSPSGYAQVTPQMDAVYRFSLLMADPDNDLLACYIDESDVPTAMSGEMPSFRRYFILKVNKKLKAMVIGSNEFIEIKDDVKQKNKQTFKSGEAKMPGVLDKVNNGIKKNFDVDLALSLSQIIPLDLHYEAANAFAYSMYFKLGSVKDGSKEESICSATATYVNVAGKFLFLYCYGSQDDLEWTRSASKAWTEMVMESNGQPPSHSSEGSGYYWSKVITIGMIGVIAAGFLVLVYGVISELKKQG